MNLFFFFFNDTATTEIYTLSLHDALPICHNPVAFAAGCAQLLHTEESLGYATVGGDRTRRFPSSLSLGEREQDRKSTRLNSSHSQISYAVFCLKKKKTSTNDVS